jgi:acetoin utilization deacetylase AcuC-like enzyme
MLGTRVAIFFNEESLHHVQDAYPSHPESPERLKGIMQKLKEHGLWKNVIPSKSGKTETLLLVHSENYVNFIKKCGDFSLTDDTQVHPETYGYATLSAECAVDAAKYSRKHGKPAFALTRPPGHHAGMDYGMGFCYFNNVALAARYLQKMGDKKIAIVDVDVHHGNGTQDIFAMDPSILYVSTHQAFLYPGTGPIESVGQGDGEGFKVNMPFQPGCGDSTFDAAFEEVIKPIVGQFKPDALLVSWGMDTHYRDALGNLKLSSEGQVGQAERLIKLSKICGNRITFMLEGGYDVPALSEVVAGVIGRAEGVEVPLEFTNNVDSNCLGRETIVRCKQIVSRYWDL